VSGFFSIYFFKFSINFYIFFFLLSQKNYNLVSLSYINIKNIKKNFSGTRCYTIQELIQFSSNKKNEESSFPLEVDPHHKELSLSKQDFISNFQMSPEG